MQPADQTYQGDARAAQMAKADCCRLLAALFYPPDKKLFVEEGITDNLGSLLRIACPGAAPLVPPVQPRVEPEDSVDLAVAYTRLFLGSPGVAAPPYASFYLDRGGGVMGPSTVEIMKIYRAAGLCLDDEFNDLPDHIAVVLEFLYYLIYREIVADAENACEDRTRFGDIRRRFLTSYVHTWVPRFCGKITAAGEHPFYTGLGQCLDVFIRSGFTEEQAGGHAPPA